jgi:ABC-2 type transport system permease protein
MQIYTEIIKQSFRQQTTYRAALVAGLITNLFFGLLRASVLIGLYGERSSFAGLTIQDAITYTGVTQSIIAFLSLFGWYQILNSVNTGEIGVELLRPIGYTNFWMAYDIGRSTLTLFVRGIPLMFVYAFLFNISLPENFAHWVVICMALTLGWLVSFGWRFLINLAAFWSPNATGIVRLGFIFSWFFSGFLMPLRFLPDWFEKLCYLTPFPHMVNTIVEIYLGLLSPLETIYALAFQLVWGGILLLFARIILNRGIQRLVIQGG